MLHAFLHPPEIGRRPRWLSWLVGCLKPGRNMDDRASHALKAASLRSAAIQNRNLRPDLIRALGLSYDPFLEPVSEKDQTPNFLDIFVDPTPSLLDRLQERASMLVFGAPGMGKTATRLALEYLLRNAPGHPPNLCVTYRPHVGEAGGHDRAALAAHHYEQIAAAAAVDSVVQVIERYDDQPEELDERQRAALARQVRACPAPFQRLIRNGARDLPASTPPDGAIWRSQSGPRHADPDAGRDDVTGIRPVVRYVVPSPRWRRLIAWMASVTTLRPEPQPWEQTVADAAALGFDAIFVLVDAVDASHVDPAAQRALLQPLLDDVAALGRKQIYLKCFVPPWGGGRTAAAVHDITLTGNIEVATIERATHNMLKALVRERLQAAGTSRVSIASLDALRREDIVESIEDRLVELADGSPRRVMELVRDFLDFHSRHGFMHADERGRPWITGAEWQEFLATISPRPISSSP